MKRSLSKLLSVISGLSAICGTAASVATADPLPGRDLLKFSQKPMIATPIADTTGQTHVYYGHDEMSTLRMVSNPTQPPFQFSGEAMADDFADNFDTPVVHVKWWGSYMNVTPGTVPPAVQNFLIAFETDVPQDATNSFSHPGSPLLTQVVTANPLFPQSGTFTEKLVPGSNPAEPVYEYNAELAIPFDQQKDTVYWLKIAALTNPGENTQWGWHNRDYTVNNALASPVPLPGERDERIELGDPGFPTPVWHFQDDAVLAATSATVSPAQLPFAQVQQSGYIPQHYIDGLDGPLPLVPGHLGIGRYSKDLAFELYTIPEPAALPFVAIGSYLLLRRRRR